MRGEPIKVLNMDLTSTLLQKNENRSTQSRVKQKLKRKPYLGRLPDQSQGEDMWLTQQGDVQQRCSTTLLAALHKGLRRVCLTQHRLKAALLVETVICCSQGLQPFRRVM